MNKFIIISIFLISIFNYPISVGAQVDGVYLVSKEGKSVKAKSSTVHHAYYATNMFRSFWHSPKRYFTDDPKINKISSISKIELRGGAYDSHTLKEFCFLKMSREQLGNTVMHTTSGGKWDSGYIVKRMEGELDEISLLNKVEITTDSYTKKTVRLLTTLDNSQIYGLWINDTYYLFQVE